MQIVLLFVSALFAVLFAAGLFWFVFLKAPGETVPLDKYWTMVYSTLGLVLSGIGAAINLASFRANHEKRRPSRKSTKKKSAPTLFEKTFTAAPYSMKSGIFGGFIGGLIGGGIAGLINGIHYYFRSQNYPGFDPATGVDILKITSTVLVVGSIFGVIIQFFILGMCRLAIEKRFPRFFFNELFGGVIGGLVGGPFVGAAMGALFGGDRSTPPPDVVPILWGGLICVLCILLAALLYERTIPWRSLGAALLIAVLLGFVVFVLAQYLFPLLRIDQNFFISEDVGTRVAIEQGVKLGLLIGALWGIEIGGTLFLYRLISPLFTNEIKRQPTAN